MSTWNPNEADIFKMCILVRKACIKMGPKKSGFTKRLESLKQNWLFHSRVMGRSFEANSGTLQTLPVEYSSV